MVKALPKLWYTTHTHSYMHDFLYHINALYTRLHCAYSKTHIPT